MKRSKALLFIILIISIIAVACTNSSKNTGSEDAEILEEETIKILEPVEDTVEEAEKPARKTKEKIMDPFLEKLPSYSRAENIGLYIRNNIANASKDEADKMFEWLLIYQNQAKDNLMYTKDLEEFKSVFNNDMKGTFDKSKVDSIQDRFMRETYTDIVNSFLIIDNYLDIYYADINWNDLVVYSSYLSDDFRKIIEIKKKVNNCEYDMYDFDIDGLSKDIILVEEVLKNKNSTFIHMMASDLYISLTSHLLVGQEDSYILYYKDKNSKEYKALMELKSKYPESKIKEIISDIDLIEVEDIQDVIDIIDRYMQFGLFSDNYIGIRIIEKNKGEYELIEVKMPSNIELQNRINDIIKLDTEKLIGNIGDNKSFELEMESYYQNERYIFYSGLIRVKDSNEKEEYLNIYRALDYVEGRYITIEDYLDVDFLFIQDYVEGITGVRIENLPEFVVYDTGIDLQLNETTDKGNSIFLKNTDLVEYFTLDELRGNN